MTARTKRKPVEIVLAEFDQAVSDYRTVDEELGRLRARRAAATAAAVDAGVSVADLSRRPGCDVSAQRVGQWAEAGR